MARWLFKEEPTHYSFDDLVRDKRTTWVGVHNALARKHLGKIRKGDRILYYHTGKEKAIVGEMRAVAAAKPDPESDDPKAVVVVVAPVRKLARPIPLSAIKDDERLADWELVRISRLSVMPVSEEQWARVMELAEDV